MTLLLFVMCQKHEQERQAPKKINCGCVIKSFGHSGMVKSAEMSIDEDAKCVSLVLDSANDGIEVCREFRAFAVSRLNSASSSPQYDSSRSRFLSLDENFHILCASNARPRKGNLWVAGNIRFDLPSNLGQGCRTY
jgi:hypothetical protein